jgi:hypothetical protein
LEDRLEKKAFAEKNSSLVLEFDRYILEHPEFADKLPDNALVVRQMGGDDEFNRWAKQAAQEVTDESTVVIYVTIARIKFKENFAEYESEVRARSLITVRGERIRISEWQEMMAPKLTVPRFCWFALLSSDLWSLAF